MTTAIDLGEINLSGEKAVMALDAVVGSLSAMERQLLSAAEQTEAGKRRIEELGTAFLEGRMGAVRLRESLQGLLGPLPKASEEIANLANQSKNAQSAVSQTASSFALFRQQIGQSLANNLVEQLLQHTQELTRDMDGLAQSSANVGIQVLAQLGPHGQLAAAAVGVYGMIAKAEREQQDAMRVTNEMLDERIRLGRLAANVEATGPRGATDAQRLQLLQAEGARIRAAVVAEENRIRGAVANMDTDAAHAATIRLRDAVNGALPGIRSYGDGVNRNTQLVEVLSAVTARNEAQLRAWGLSVQFGANAATNSAAAIQALSEQRERTAMVARQSAQREVELARAQVDAARRMAGGRAAIEASTEASARLRRASTELAAAEREVAAATGAATRAAHEHAVAVDTEIAANNRLKDAAREAQKHAATARAEANAHSAQEIRDLRHQIGLALERTRGVVMHTRYIGLSISSSRELTELEQRRARFESQRHHTFAQRQRYVADLQREIELRTMIVDQERSIREALSETARAREDAQRSRDAATVDALNTQEREKQQQAMESDSARKALESEALASAEAIRNGPIEMLKSAGQSLTSSLGGAFAAVVNGSKSVKAAVMEALQATMESLASESFGKALFEGASALAALAGGNIPSAVLHGKAAAGFAATAVVAGGLAAGGAALSSASSGASAVAGGGSAPSPSAGLPSGPRGGSDGAMAPITINYNAPVIGGRDAMAWETGARIGRYLGQADSRVRRAPAIMGA